MSTTSYKRSVDSGLKARALAVIPGGMYGHQSTARLPASYPQFFERADGCRLWDCDGNEYIDFMCSYGPILLGHHHPGVDRAAAAQQAAGDCMTGPSARVVELAELMTDMVTHADWAMFQKNGTDATTICVTLARAETQKRKVLVARGLQDKDRSRWDVLGLWDVATGKERALLKGHPTRGYALAFSPDGELLAAGTGTLALDNARPEITIRIPTSMTPR